MSKSIQLEVSEIWTYIIKSCKGTLLERARVGVHGIEHDRRFMVVHKQTGMFEEIK